MADLKNVLFDYFAQRHFDLMPPNVHDRFEDISKNGDFTGHQKHWADNYEGRMAVALAPLTNDEWEQLYDAFQETLQGMNASRNPSVGFASEYNDDTKKFIDRWFGDDTKTFTTDKATGSTKFAFDELANFLDANKNKLEVPFKTNMSNVFSDGMTYEKFYKDLRAGKYNDNLEFRQKVRSVIQYIQYYGPQQGDPNDPDPSYWPKNVGYAPIVPPVVSVDVVAQLKPILDPAALPPANRLDPDENKWYAITHKNTHIGWFKRDYVKLFDELLTNATIRKHFLAQAPDLVRKSLETAIADTDYENKDSDDYVSEKLVDDKNWRQKLKQWGQDTYENHLRRFTNPSRGTRLFFSPWSQNIMKALDKAGVKPTEGIDGILSKKDDPKIQKALDASPKTKKHFKWFTDTMETLKKGMPDAYEGALRNGAQLRSIVSALIVEAAKQGKVEEAKTAMEILSVAKYGLLSSRTLEALQKTDVNIFGDDAYSWNKNEYIKPVAKAADRLAKTLIVGVGMIGAGAHNFIQHRRTKIKSDIRKNKVLDDAYKKWEADDAKKHHDLQTSNARHMVPMKLATLAAGAGLSGHVITPATIEIEKTILAGMTPGTPGYDELKQDIDLFEDTYARQQRDTNWRNDNPDAIHDLVAYWDLLESVGKTHSFMLGSMKVKRENMLRNFKNKSSNAQNIANAYITSFGALQHS